MNFKSIKKSKLALGIAVFLVLASPSIIAMALILPNRKTETATKVEYKTPISLYSPVILNTLESMQAKENSKIKLPTDQNQLTEFKDDIISLAESLQIDKELSKIDNDTTLSEEQKTTEKTNIITKFLEENISAQETTGPKVFESNSALPEELVNYKKQLSAHINTELALRLANSYDKKLSTDAQVKQTIKDYVVFAQKNANLLKKLKENGSEYELVLAKLLAKERNSKTPAPAKTIEEQKEQRDNFYQQYPKAKEYLAMTTKDFEADESFITQEQYDAKAAEIKLINKEIEDKIKALDTNKQKDPVEINKIKNEIFKKHNTNAGEFAQIENNPNDFNKIIRQILQNQKANINIKPYHMYGLTLIKTEISTYDNSSFEISTNPKLKDTFEKYIYLLLGYISQDKPTQFIRDPKIESILKQLEVSGAKIKKITLLTNKLTSENPTTNWGRFVKVEFAQPVEHYLAKTHAKYKGITLDNIVYKNILFELNLDNIRNNNATLDAAIVKKVKEEKAQEVAEQKQLRDEFYLGYPSAKQYEKMAVEDFVNDSKTITQEEYNQKHSLIETTEKEIEEKIAQLPPEKQDDLEEQSKIIAEVYKAHNTNAEELNQLQTNPEELNKTIRSQVGNEKATLSVKSYNLYQLLVTRVEISTTDNSTLKLPTKEEDKKAFENSIYLTLGYNPQDPSFKKVDKVEEIFKKIQNENVTKIIILTNYDDTKEQIENFGTFVTIKFADTNKADYVDKNEFFDLNFKNSKDANKQLDADIAAIEQESKK
ncbi:hypothetical protein [Mycoplasma sp. 1654_15]|uniref:hypothetical protein n=1 Tax=Mycoplasma sp. 1654_15 TaxID=2725994 RepID=UPI001598C168|nr:hypothetical protein [Mycoplasma sp. 1654_15]QKG28180.1 hypothetical protein HF996_02585 [Mycoplasma sp. 1654_15]